MTEYRHHTDKNDISQFKYITVCLCFIAAIKPKSKPLDKASTKFLTSRQLKRGHTV